MGLIYNYEGYGDGRYRIYVSECPDVYQILSKREMQIVIRASTLLGNVCVPAKFGGEPIDMKDFK